MGDMDLRVFTEPQQGATYQELLKVAQAAEDLDFGAFYRSDHYLAMGDADGLPGPTDAWITLAGLATQTRRIRLGTLMTAATFRLPGPLAIQVAQVDAMSGGRVEFGLGTGWYAEEHSAYGIPFPARRFGLLEEQLEIVTGLWSTPLGERFSYDGAHYQLKDSPALPKPAQSRVPVLVGGKGATRTPQLAARFADEFNLPFGTLAETAQQFARVRAAAEEQGRAADDLVYSNALVVCVGQDDAQVARRAAAIGRDVAELKENGVAGTPNEAVEKIGRFAELGSSRIYLQFLDLSDLGHLELVAAEVMRQLP